MGSFASIVTDTFGDTNRTEADAAAKKAFTIIIDHLSDMLDVEAGDSPFRRQIVAEDLLAKIQSGVGIFTQSSITSAKEAGAITAPAPKDEVDPYDLLTSEEQDAVDAVRHHDLRIVDGEPVQVTELRTRLNDLEGIIDDVDEVLVGSSTLPTDRSIADRKNRMTKSIQVLKDQPAKDQEDLTDTIADAIGESQRGAKESLVKYQQRIDAALKAKLAKAGTAASVDTKPIAKALGMPEDSSAGDIATNAGNAHAWRVESIKLAAAALGSQPGADAKPEEVLPKVDQTLRALKPGRNSGNGGTNPNAGNNR